MKKPEKIIKFFQVFNKEKDEFYFTQLRFSKFKINFTLWYFKIL